VTYRWKRDILGLVYISVAESLLISSATFIMQWAPEAIPELGEVTQNKGHCAVQDYSMSPILVPIESSCTASY